MTLISPHWPPKSSCICLAKMGSGLSGFALYWKRLVWKNTCAPFRARDLEVRRPWLGLHFYRCSPHDTSQTASPGGPEILSSLFSTNLVEGGSRKVA
jgi:hypothetical protein